MKKKLTRRPIKVQTALTMVCQIIKPDGPPAARGASSIKATDGTTVTDILVAARDFNAGVCLLRLMDAVGPEGHVSFMTAEETLKAELICEGTGWKKQDFESDDIEDLMDDLLAVAIVEPEESDEGSQGPAEGEEDERADDDEPRAEPPADDEPEDDIDIDDDDEDDRTEPTIKD